MGSFVLLLVVLKCIPGFVYNISVAVGGKMGYKYVHRWTRATAALGAFAMMRSLGARRRLRNCNRHARMPGKAAREGWVRRARETTASTVVLEIDSPCMCFRGFGSENLKFTNCPKLGGSAVSASLSSSFAAETHERAGEATKDSSLNLGQL